MLLSFILAIVVSVYLSKRITRPLIKLRDATQEISKGNLHVKIEERSEMRSGS